MKKAKAKESVKQNAKENVRSQTQRQRSLTRHSRSLTISIARKRLRGVSLRFAARDEKLRRIAQGAW